ncbi:hypothetical protein [Paracoccus sp. Z118]|nr:hypothetical protein [Paracoccus sp. Z118]
MKQGRGEPINTGMFRYFDIQDRVRLPGRFFGASLTVTARL